MPRGPARNDDTRLTVQHRKDKSHLFPEKLVSKDN